MRGVERWGAIYAAALGQRPKQHCALTHPIEPARDRPGDSTGHRLSRHGLHDVADVAAAQLESYLTAALFRQILARIEGLAWHPT